MARSGSLAEEAGAEWPVYFAREELNNTWPRQTTPATHAFHSRHRVKLFLTGLQTQFPRKLPAGHAGTFPNLQTEKRYCLNPRRLGAGPVLISL